MYSRYASFGRIEIRGARRREVSRTVVRTASLRRVVTPAAWDGRRGALRRPQHERALRRPQHEGRFGFLSTLRAERVEAKVGVLLRVIAAD